MGADSVAIRAQNFDLCCSQKCADKINSSHLRQTKTKIPANVDRVVNVVTGEVKLTKKGERTAILAKSGGYCWYCGCKLDDKWDVDHFFPIFRETFKGVTTVRYPNLDVIGNKVPSCKPCNNWKKTFTIEEFRTEIAMLPSRLYRDSSGFRMAIRLGMIERTEKPVVFWFECEG
jgi:5-methylcytosine-specific restriction endonuclease McrA